MTLLASTFTSLRAQQRVAFIPFLMAGDPDLATTLKAMHQLVEAGADILEIGMPFSDPMADGPVIEAAGGRALAQGTSLDDVFALVQQFRQQNTTTPIVLMGYCNPAYVMGWEAFADALVASGVNGVILVDLPTEEEDELLPTLRQHSIDLIRFITPTTSAERRQHILTSASGFLYYIAVAGITGDKGAILADLTPEITALRQQTSLPIAIGFGIKTAKDAARMAEIGDGVVVGSALVDTLHRQGLGKMIALAREIKQAMIA